MSKMAPKPPFGHVTNVKNPILFPASGLRRLKHLFQFKSQTLGIKNENAGVEKWGTHLIYRPALENSGEGWVKRKSITFHFLSQKCWTSFIFNFFSKIEWPGAGLGWICCLCLSAQNLCAWLKSVHVCDEITFLKDTGDKLNFYTVLPLSKLN